MNAYDTAIVISNWGCQRHLRFNVLDYCSPRSHRTGMTPNHGTLKQLTREGRGGGGGDGGNGGTLSLKKVIQNIPLDAPPPLHFHAPGATIGANTVILFAARFS